METSKPAPASVGSQPQVIADPMPRIFYFCEVEAPGGSSTLRCNTRAKLEAARFDLQGVMVRLPLKLRKRLELQTAGALSVTLCALAEYALDRLEADGKGIVVGVATGAGD